MFKRIDHVEILPANFEKSLAFYQEVLKFKLHQRIPMSAGPLKEIAYLKLGDTMVEFLHMENPTPAPNATAIGYKIIALEVASMEEATAYLKECGVTISWGPLDLGDSIRAEFLDPDGLTVELREWK